MAELKGTSLLEAVVASVLFLIVFLMTMELVPRLTVRDDEGVWTVEADYRMMRAFDKYATGLWPAGEYTEEYDWGNVIVKIAPYRTFADLQAVEVTVRINGVRRRMVYRQIIICNL